MVLGAWRGAVGGIVVGQGVLGEEFGVILVRLPGFDELTDLWGEREREGGGRGVSKYCLVCVFASLSIYIYLFYQYVQTI